MKLLLVFIALICLSVAQDSICVRNAQRLGLTHRQLVQAAVTSMIVNEIANDTELKPYFDGTKPPGSINYFADNTALAALNESLVRFFGAALGCNDSTIAAYAGKSMADAHKNLSIPFIVHSRFIVRLGNVAASFNFSGEDIGAIATLLHGLVDDICTDVATCKDSLCNRRSKPGLLSNTQLVAAAVNNVVGLIVNSTILKPYFDGTKPAGSTNFIANQTALGILGAKLISFFGGALGCSDGTIPPYAGKSMAEAHANMTIDKAAFEAFNAAVVATLINVGNFTPAEGNGVGGVLESLRAEICTQPDCKIVNPTTAAPTGTPTTAAPTGNPTGNPTTAAPTGGPTTAAPTGNPTTAAPTAAPTSAPTAAPVSSAINVAVLSSLLLSVIALI